jgi:hypothetical protein
MKALVYNGPRDVSIEQEGFGGEALRGVEGK